MDLASVYPKDGGLETFLKTFSRANHVYVRAYDSSARPVFAFPGSSDEEALLKKYIPAETVKFLLDAFTESPVEEVIEGESFAPFVEVRAVAAKNSNHAIQAIFIMAGVTGEHVSDDEQVKKTLRLTSMDSFDSSVELLKSFIDYYFSQRIENINLSNTLNETIQAGGRLEELLKRNEVMTDILKMLEEEGDFINVCDGILKNAGAFLDVSDAFLVRISPDRQYCDIICEWKQEGFAALSPDYVSASVERLPFLTDRPYTISSDSALPPAFKAFFDKHEITAGMFLPVSINGEVSMYLSFVASDPKRQWSIEDIRFSDDVRRVISTILVKRVTKNSLASSYAALDCILENTGCGITVFDPRKKKFLYENGTFQKMFFDEGDRSNVCETLFKQSGISGDEAKHYYAANSAKTYELSSANIRWVDGSEVVMSTFYDITKLKEYQIKIEEQASTDFLTGLSNRMRFEMDFIQEIREAVRSGEEGTLLYMDLDDFRGINEGLGHHVGDFLLKEAAEALRVICGKKARCYRIGGDEFAVLLPAKHHEVRERLIDAIEKRFSKPWQLETNEYYCTICMGVCLFPKDGTKTDQLTQRADLSLRMAKQKGKNVVEYYSNSDPKVLTRRLDLERSMRGAVERGCKEFIVYYQPLINVSKNEPVCCGAEALVRWQSEELGFVYPDEFIPIAENLGLIVPIGEHVLIEACKRCRYWNDYGHPDYKVSVNLSIVQLLQKNIVETVKNALNFSGLSPENLTLEVTESLAANDMPKMKKILNDIKALGVRLALDDFGTGYSSLSRLRDMPMDVIKIDKSFADDVGKDDFSDAFVKTVSDLADTINMDVVMEGIEEDSQEKALVGMKIDMIQGYLFDKPLTREQFEEKYVD